MSRWGTLLVAILIPSLKYQDLQGFRDVKPADIKVVSVQRDALTKAGAQPDEVVALDPRPSGAVIVYFDTGAKR
jgi:hypothetical protein